MPLSRRIEKGIGLFLARAEQEVGISLSGEGDSVVSGKSGSGSKYLYHSYHLYQPLWFLQRDIRVRVA